MLKMHLRSTHLKCTLPFLLPPVFSSPWRAAGRGTALQSKQVDCTGPAPHTSTDLCCMAACSGCWMEEEQHCGNAALPRALVCSTRLGFSSSGNQVSLTICCRKCPFLLASVATEKIMAPDLIFFYKMLHRIQVKDTKDTKVFSSVGCDYVQFFAAPALCAVVTN